MLNYSNSSVFYNDIIYDNKYTFIIIPILRVNNNNRLFWQNYTYISLFSFCVETAGACFSLTMILLDSVLAPFTGSKNCSFFKYLLIFMHHASM